MKKILTITLFLFGLSVLQIAHADQCAYINKKEVNKALALLKIESKYIEFCEPCGDKDFRQFQQKNLNTIDTLKVDKVDEKQWEISLNGSPIDLAYTYLKQNDQKFWNVSKLSGCESDSVTTVFSRDGLASNTKYIPKSPEKYSEYCNDRFGFCLDVPSILKKQLAPNGDGLSLRMSIFDDGTKPFNILAFGNTHINIDELPHSLEEVLKSYKEDVEKITYQKKEDNWFVISGYNDSGKSIFYKKVYVGKQNLNSLSIHYPRKDKKLYDDVVNRIVGSFNSGDLD
jgi:hypothetical protein